MIFDFLCTKLSTLPNLISFVLETKCIFAVGDIVGEGEEYVGNTDTPDECENLVRKREPTASGMKWGDPILMNKNNYMEKHPGDYIDGFSALRRCYAEFGNEVQDAESWRVCLFQRKYLNGLLL